MKKILETALSEIIGFKELNYRLERDLILNGKSQKTYKCYIRQIAYLSLHFKKSVLEVSDEQISDYLFELKKKSGLSESYFKTTVYGLRYLFRLYSREDKLIKLPGIPRKKQLPVILSQQEVKKLLLSPDKFKDRFMIALIYSAGLRMGELQKLERTDIDVERMLIHIRQGKGQKDRYVVLSKLIAAKFGKYCREYKIEKYVFPGQKQGNYISRTTVRKIIKTALIKCGIEKNINTHSLRHSFATHMLENGIDIVTVKEQLGHSDINTTMLYLQVALLERKTAVSPLDFLNEIK